MSIDKHKQKVVHKTLCEHITGEKNSQVAWYKDHINVSIDVSTLPKTSQGR